MTRTPSHHPLTNSGCSFIHKKAYTFDYYEKIWRLMNRIPRGRITTYKELARASGNPKASRAVGNACNANPDAPRTPCHRVVGSSGKLGGYAHGAGKKIRLLAKEGVRVENGVIAGFAEKMYKFK